MLGRIAAAIIAAVACTGLVVQYVATAHGLGGDVGSTLWTILRFFTIWTNIVVAVAFTGSAFGARWVRPILIGGVTLSILLVGVIYGLLLSGLRELSGGAALADMLLHKVTPLLAPLWWLAFAPKRTLNWRAPWLWAIFPAAYLPYALLRGRLDGNYAYPFLNIVKLGVGPVMVNALVIGLGFLLAGFAMVWIDRRR